VIINGREEQLTLTYPCNWSYRVITHMPDAIHSIVTEVVRDRSYKCTFSNISKNGTYHSFEVEILVHHDEDRVALFELFKQHSAIKMVL